MEQFEQLLTCAICLDRYRNPKLLPCQHSFCMEPCLEGLVDYVRRQVSWKKYSCVHVKEFQSSNMRWVTLFTFFLNSLFKISLHLINLLFISSIFTRCFRLETLSFHYYSLCPPLSLQVVFFTPSALQKASRLVMTNSLKKSGYKRKSVLVSPFSHCTTYTSYRHPAFCEYSISVCCVQKMDPEQNKFVVYSCSWSPWSIFVMYSSRRSWEHLERCECHWTLPIISVIMLHPFWWSTPFLCQQPFYYYCIPYGYYVFRR